MIRHYTKEFRVHVDGKLQDRINEELREFERTRPGELILLDHLWTYDLYPEELQKPGIMVAKKFALAVFRTEPQPKEGK